MIEKLEGNSAWLALCEALKRKRPSDNFSCAEQAFERLRWTMTDSNLSPKDRLARLRHGLRYASLSLGVERLHLPQVNDWGNKACFKEFGLRIHPGELVEADPWRPEWLKEKTRSVDDSAMEALPRPWIKPPISDPWIQNHFDFESFKGPGQALAVRSVLHMPEDETLIVILPTGEGKSLIYQALAIANPQKTIAVVVPTVSLAVDQEMTLEDKPELKPENPHAYIGGQDNKNSIILEAIPSGKQGLLFGSPEAFVASLRVSLMQCAEVGRLEAIIIDEAHLVFAWGSDFRSDYQLLAALVTELRSIAPKGKKPKLVCLSATVDQESLKTLDSLFSPEKPISIISSARLRPEIEMWVAPIAKSLNEREARVIEALKHLPRPIILYVTTKEDAEKWKIRIKDEGFINFKMIHGGSDNSLREKVVKHWKTGKLDLVVGTSAFGLGINYLHARSVIHACIPESLNRYYQEIGRTGRDNQTSVSILLPEITDFSVANGISEKKFISNELGLSRWEAMFHKKNGINHDTRVISVDLSVSPSYEPYMKGQRHENWNERVLNLMTLSGLIQLVGTHYDTGLKKTLVKIKIIKDGHLDLQTWETDVDITRKRMYESSKFELELMVQFINNKNCSSRLFQKIYTLKHNKQNYKVTLACGGCFFCRNKYSKGWFINNHKASKPVWRIGFLSDYLCNYFIPGRNFIEWSEDFLKNPGGQRRLQEMLEIMWNDGVHKFIIIGELNESLKNIIQKKTWCFVMDPKPRILIGNGLPSGPEIIWVGRNIQLSVDHYTNNSDQKLERIFFIPDDFKDPLNPDDLFKLRHSPISLEMFCDRVNS